VDTVTRRDLLRAVASTPAVSLLTACDVREFAYRHGGKHRLSIATGNTGSVVYVYGGAIAKVISAHLPRVEATAELTSGSVDNLKLLARGAVDLAAVTGDSLDDALRRRGAFASGPAAPARTLATLYGAPLHLATFDDTGISRLRDLRGRHVSTGAPGAGTETITLRALAAGGLDPDRDIRRARLGFSASAEALKDGKLDACFIGGGLPQPSVRDLASTQGRRLRLVPLDDVLPSLQRRFGASVYPRFVIPGGSYPGNDADVVVPGFHVLLVCDERMDEALAHDITRLLFDRKADLVAVHRAADELTPRSASAPSPAPLHPGAERYYREVGALGT
jgi:uncharacterized protein